MGFLQRRIQYMKGIVIQLSKRVMAEHSGKISWSRVREVFLYFVIAIIIVGTEVIVLVRNPTAAMPPLPILWCIFNTVLLAGYLIHSFRRKLRHGRFWFLLMALLSLHILWSLSVPLLFSMIAIGPEFFLFALLLRRI